MGREDEIRLIAYNIWEEEGYPDGQNYEHWLRAEAIWEQGQNRKATVAKGTEPEVKQPIKRNTRVMAAKKKSPKT